MIATDNEISHFLNVYLKRHFTNAAKELNISQPALTQSISRLETKMNTKLFVRSKKGCKPTAHADLLFLSANRLKECWEDIEKSVLAAQELPIAKFRLGCHQSVGSYTLPNFIRTLHDKAPLIELRLVHDFSRKITEQIVNCELDFGFVVNPIRHPDLILTKLANDRVCYWSNPTKKNIPKLVFSDLSSFEVKGFSKDWKLIETPSLELIRTLAIQGAGVGLLPERVARADFTKLKIVKNTPIRQDEIYLAYRMEALKSAAGKIVIETAKRCISTF
jgi:DNA-binding transcriptional LysR family regulator